MAEEKKRPTLKELSQQLFALCEDFEDLSWELMDEDELPDVKRKDIELWIENIAGLLRKTYEASATAADTLHPAVLDGNYPPNDSFNKISVLFLLRMTSEFLENVLHDVFEAKETEKQCKEWGEPLDEDFKTPWQCLIDGYCYLRISWNRDWGNDIEVITKPLKGIANELAGIFLKEQTEKTQTQTVDSPNIEIPAERRTTPLSLTRMAQYWGGDMTSKKVKAMIKSGSLKAVQLNRQTFIFDTKYLPANVISKVKR